MPLSIRRPLSGIIYRKVAFSDAGLSAGVLFGTVPKGAVITDCRTIVSTAFNATGTDYWRVGINAGGFEFSGIDINIGVVGVSDHMNAYGLNPLAADRTVYGRYVGTGDAATAGLLYFVMQYMLGL